jgi:L,D-transpeptidase YcbB
MSIYHIAARLAFQWFESVMSVFARRSVLKALIGLPVLWISPALAQDQLTTQSITSIPAKLAVQGKLATQTEILSDRTEAPMISPGAAEALEGAIARYEEIVAGGGWPTVPNRKFDKKASGEHVITLRQRFVREGFLDLETLTGAAPEKMDAELLDAVKAFQRAHGIAPTGKVDERTLAEMNISAESRLATLRENLPRVIAYTKDLSSRAIIVNIPAAQLETIDGGVVYSRHNVVVGKLERPTPTLASKVTDVTFNPFWNAPASIVARDIIPKYLKDPNYLDQMNIRVFDGVGGPEIEPSSVDWENTPPERFHFQQQPGENNALATVKVNFKNEHMVYMHDTPHRELFQTNARFESSGCVRVDQVRSFISWILQGQEDFDEAQFEMITASEITHAMKVTNAPDVRFMYLTAWATEDGVVQFRPDIYQLDGRGFIYGQPDPLEPT